MKISDLKVLIIEDELIFARQLENWLKKHTSEVFVSTNSENGTFYLTQEKPDIIFLDNQLPGLNGIDVIEFYKEKSPKSILVLMSSVFSLDEIATALKNGADYVLNKRDEHEMGLNSILKASVSTKQTGNPFWKFVEFVAPEKSKSAQQIVILEDEELFSFQLSMILNNLPSQKKHSIHRFSSTSELKDHFAKHKQVDVLFLDFELGGENAHGVLEFMQKEKIACKTIIISSKIDLDTALNLNLVGVSEFILKDADWQDSIRECASRLKL